MWFDVSHNSLTLSGTLAPLANLAMFSRPSWSVPVPRVLDLSHNNINAPFPAFMLSVVPQIALTCDCEVSVTLSGGANRITCPAAAPALQDAALRVLRSMEFTCMDPSTGLIMDLAPALQGRSVAGMGGPAAFQNLSGYDLLAASVPPLDSNSQLAILLEPGPAAKGELAGCS